MATAYVDCCSWASEAFDLGGQIQSGDEDWFCDLDFSDLPQLPIEAESANLPFLDDLFLLDGRDSADSVSSVHRPEDTSSADCRRQKDFDVSSESIENSKVGTTFSLLPIPPLSLSSDEAATLPHVEEARPLLAIDFTVASTLCQAESAGTAEMHNGSASEYVAEDRSPDFGAKARPDVSEKKRIRLLRNRELAFESRQRKKSYIKELESKCRVLEQERNQLHHQVCVFSSENAVLKEELSRMKRKKGSIGVAEPAALTDSLPSEFLLHLMYLSVLVILSLPGKCYLDLLLVTVHLQVLGVKAEGPETEVNSKARSLALWTSGRKHQLTALEKLCSFSFWRRRRKYYNIHGPVAAFGLQIYA